ncbi:hypothetical protein EJB05_15997, partial [Eragrostis curvula]
MAFRDVVQLLLERSQAIPLRPVAGLPNNRAWSSCFQGYQLLSDRWWRRLDTALCTRVCDTLAMSMLPSRCLAVPTAMGFISKVSTIGRIHHINVVRLVGFCAEEMRRALVYYVFKASPASGRKFFLGVLVTLLAKAE